MARGLARRPSVVGGAPAAAAFARERESEQNAGEMARSLAPGVQPPGTARVPGKLEPCVSGDQTRALSVKKARCRLPKCFSKVASDCVFFSARPRACCLKAARCRTRPRHTLPSLARRRSTSRRTHPLRSSGSPTQIGFACLQARTHSAHSLSSVGEEAARRRTSLLAAAPVRPRARLGAQQQPARCPQRAARKAAAKRWTPSCAASL